MRCWTLFWFTFFYSFGYHIYSGCSQRTIRSQRSLRRITRQVLPYSTHTVQNSGTIPPLLPVVSENTQEMARTFSSLSKSSLSKYLSSKVSSLSDIKSNQYTFKKPRPKFRPVYSNRRKAQAHTRKGTSSTNVGKKNSTKPYKGGLKKQLMKSLLVDEPNKPSIYTRLYSFFSGIDPSAFEILKKRSEQLENYPTTSPDANTDTGLSVIREAESRTGLILASTVGLMQSFLVVSTSVGLGSILMMVLTLLLKLAIKAIIAAAVTIYLL